MTVVNAASRVTNRVNIKTETAVALPDYDPTPEEVDAFTCALRALDALYPVTQMDTHTSARTWRKSALKYPDSKWDRSARDTVRAMCYIFCDSGVPNEVILAVYKKLFLKEDQDALTDVYYRDEVRHSR